MLPALTELFATDGDGNTYRLDDPNLTYTVRGGDYTQYGYYALAPDGKGNYTLIDNPTEVEGIGEGYGYYREKSVGESGTDYSLLTEDEINSLDHAQIESLTGKSFDSLVNGVDYVIAPDKSIYVRVEEGKGVYSDKVYNRKLFKVTFKVDGKFENPVDCNRVKEFMDIVKEFRKTL